MQSSKKIQLERKFLSTEMPFQTAQPQIITESSRFPKIIAMYAYNRYLSEHGATVHEWCVSDVKELRMTAQMYWKRYNILSR